VAKPATPEELARATERVEGAFQATGRTLERLTRERGVRPMQKLIESAAAEMQRKVSRLAPDDETFTAVQQRAILAQYRAMLLDLQPRMTRVLGEASREAQVESIRSMVKTLALAELEFEGVTTPLPLTQAARMAGIIDRDRASLLRQHDVSVRTYGVDSITQAERYLGQAFATQRSYSETVAGLFDMVDQSRYRAERIVRTECLVESTRVDAAMVLAAHRRPYVGPVVEIVTGDGSKLTTTPNHPMLTRRGWVASGELREGDDLVCHLGPKYASSSRDEDVTAPPSTIGEIFDSLSAVGVGKRVRTAEPDFHGDGRDGYVDVHIPFRPLKVGNFTAFPKSLSKDVFTPSDESATAFCGRCNNLLSMQKTRCLCDPTNTNSGVTNPLMDGVALGLELDSKSLGRLAFKVSSDNLFRGQVSAGLVVPSAAPEKQFFGLADGSHNAGRDDDLADPVVRPMHTLGNDAVRNARTVQFKRVVSLGLRQFEGHVFNLTTVNGYFSVEGVYTGNTSFAWSAAHASALDEASELIPGLFRRWVEYVNDQTGAPLDGRVANDSLVLHGQVAFTPADGATMEARSTFLVGGTGGFEMPRDGRVNAKLWGKRYAHPPNRPNDRSRIVGWKVDWPVPAYMVVNGQRMDVKKALALMSGKDADEAREDAEGVDIPEQTLASAKEVDEARAGFARERQRRRNEAAAKRAKPVKATK
jgi:hypothetical protein